MTKKKPRKLTALPRITSKTITAASLLRKIKRLILTEPKRLNMGAWVARFGGKQVEGAAEYVEKEAEPRCGTVACMAGWGAVLLRPARIKGETLDRNAENVMTDLVGFDNVYGYSSVEGLFSADTASTPGTTKHAKEVAGRIDRYLEDNPELEERVINVADARKALRG